MFALIPPRFRRRAPLTASLALALLAASAAPGCSSLSEFLQTPDDGAEIPEGEAVGTPRRLEVIEYGPLHLPENPANRIFRPDCVGSECVRLLELAKRFGCRQVEVEGLFSGALSPRRPTAICYPAAGRAESAARIAAGAGADAVAEARLVYLVGWNDGFRAVRTHEELLQHFHAPGTARAALAYALAFSDAEPENELLRRAELSELRPAATLAHETHVARRGPGFAANVYQSRPRQGECAPRSLVELTYLVGPGGARRLLNERTVLQGPEDAVVCVD